MTATRHGKGIFVRLFWGTIDHIRTRNVEVISVSLSPINYEADVPAWVFQCQSLISLELDCSESHMLFKQGIITTFLPNLKKLSWEINEEGNHTTFSDILFKSCPLLEDLSLKFNFNGSKEPLSVVDISCPNLKYLHLDTNDNCTSCEFVINAPKLVDISIYDCCGFSSFRFVQMPSSSLKGVIEVRDIYDFDDYGAATTMSKLVLAMSSASHLSLICNDEVYPHLTSIFGGKLLIFPNLSCLTVNMDVPASWKNLLLFLECFPPLEILKLEFPDYFKVESVIPPVPDPLPGDFLGKLKELEVSPVNMDECNVDFLEFILKKAGVLEQVVIKAKLMKYLEDQQLREMKFCKALFKLPRISLTCEVKFFGICIEYAASNNVRDGRLVCELALNDCSLLCPENRLRYNIIH